MPIKNIIFDLGGVIINIDYKKTANAFRKFGSISFDEVYNQNKQDFFIDDYEIGKISSEKFRSILKYKLGISISDSEFDNAWNAMLLDLPPSRLEFIKKLRSEYKVFLFSNTNDIHLKEVFNICQKQNGFAAFHDFFDKEYYSNILGKRKPHAEAFLHILHENGLNAHETLFIDDSLQHILGARAVGLHAIHLTKEKNLFDLKFFISAHEKN
ncbi:MAG: HAD family phosphatase [Gammaproteobacteria bacterium]|nr:HAD family phosphatase [Gammaproteobacteria bacterium]